MTLIEAIKSGKRIKRFKWDNYYTPESMHYSVESVLAEDYLIEEKTITITKSEFIELYHQAQDAWSHFPYFETESHLACLIKVLGF